MSKKKIKKDCHDLDISFFKWCRKRLPVFLKDADKHIDLEYNQIAYKGEPRTLKSLIEDMIYILDLYFENKSEFDEIERYRNGKKFLEIWNITCLYLWW